uniref:Phospholipid/glycerol acyltransferase domain-containing protein n=1 Tax=Oryza glumipatula TaxID=40148 RepID=A0A0D9YC14_9ORYZ
MVLPTILPKIAAHWLFTFYRAARKLRGHAFQYCRSSSATTTKPPPPSPVSPAAKCTVVFPDAADKAVVFGFDGALMRSAALFPYFMLVACEGGSLLRALLLLCAFPLVWALGERSDAGVRVMAFVTFFGLRPRDMDLVARAVLPKFYMEGLNAQVYSRLWLPARRKVVVTGAPRVMVEWFLKEYMAADVVVGGELHVVRVGRGRYFTGMLCGPGGSAAPALKHKALQAEALGTDNAMADVAVVGNASQLDHPCFPYCKEVYVVNRESTKTARLPRGRYPKPLIFHDGRLAFLPTPSAALAFFLFLPLGVILSVIRISIGILLPYKISFGAGALFGVRYRTSGLRAPEPGVKRRGVLYVCTHRTLVDPIMLTAALQKPVPAVTYSLSRLSEVIAPIKTVRLTRDRERDAETMSRLLEHGDLAVCPEGTTCREPYLLRFSPLFAELADDMEPVALDAQVTTLYGTTASGHKWLDPVVFFANPQPAYRVDFLGAVPREWTRAGGRAGAEVANWVQRRLGEALGYECTGLTRRDKYMMLAGNDGVVAK